MNTFYIDNIDIEKCIVELKLDNDYFTKKVFEDIICIITDDFNITKKISIDDIEYLFYEIKGYYYEYDDLIYFIDDIYQIDKDSVIGYYFNYDSYITDLIRHGSYTIIDPIHYHDYKDVNMHNRIFRCYDIHDEINHVLEKMDLL